MANPKIITAMHPRITAYPPIILKSNGPPSRPPNSNNEKYDHKIYDQKQIEWALPVLWTVKYK